MIKNTSPAQEFVLTMPINMCLPLTNAPLDAAHR
jgi:hypothetical protein